VLSNLLTIVDNSYANAGNRAIHSAELLARLYLQGDHMLTASYTFLWATTDDVGVVRSMPNNWLSFGATFNLVRDIFDVNANLNVIGSVENPVRYPNGPGSFTGSTTSTSVTDVGFFRAPPTYLLQLGARERLLRSRMQISAQLYNVLNQQYYQPNPYYELPPSTQILPVPGPGFNFFTSISYRFL
jgi:hypothetical protein